MTVLKLKPARVMPLNELVVFKFRPHIDRRKQ